MTSGRSHPVDLSPVTDGTNLEIELTKDNDVADDLHKGLIKRLGVPESGY